MQKDIIDQERLEYLYKTNNARLLDNVSEDIHRRLRDKLLAQGFKGLKLSFSSVMGNMSFSGSRLVEIAELTGMSKQAVGQIANEIEELGYIARVPDPHDGRAKNLIYTELGQQLLAASIAAVEEVEQEYSALIGNDKLQQLESILKELSAKIPNKF